jgi:hypothetical protein
MFARLTAGRDGLAGPPERMPVAGHAGAVYSIEAGPNGRLYVSDARGIYRLVPA